MDKYRRLLVAVRDRPRTARVLKLVDIFAVLFTVIFYVAALILVSLSDLLVAVRLGIICAVPFVIVSLVRRWINAPRPYEVYSDIYEVAPKSRAGASFPSRHAFSVFAIGTELLFVYPMPAVAVLILGVLLSVSRVLLGKHFVRDVLAGALLGALTSLIGILILYF